MAYGTHRADLSADARQVAGLLESLAKSARAGRLYAPNNRALEAFRTDLLGRFAAYFERWPELTLRVRPDRFLWGEDDEAVWEDADREQGFPFRLYRDGVRELTLTREIEEQNLLALVAILGTRSLGQLAEEDLGTRLWRMRSEHIRYRRVTGFLDARRERPTDLGAHGDGAMAMALAEPLPGDALQSADQPDEAPKELFGRWVDEWSFPPLPARRRSPPTFKKLDPNELRTFHTGLAFDPSVALCHVVARCIDTGLNGLIPGLAPEELRTLVEDARDAMLVSGDAHSFLRVLRFLQDHRRRIPKGEWRDVLDHLVEGGDQHGPVGMLLATVARGDARAADVLFALRPLQGIPAAWLVEALGDAPDEPSRVAVADTVVELLWPDEDRLEELLESCDASSRRAMVSALTRVAPDGSARLLSRLFPDADAETQVRILAAAISRRSIDGLPRLAKRALASTSDEVRILGLRAAALARNPKLLEPIRQLIEPARLMEMSRETAVEALRTYAGLPGKGRLGWLIKQARPPRRVLVDPAIEELGCRYALALGALGDERAESALRQLQGKGSANFQDAVKAALRRSRRERRR